MRDDERAISEEIHKNPDLFKEQFKELETQQVTLSELREHSQINHLLQSALHEYPSRVLRSSRSTARQPQRKGAAGNSGEISAVKGLQLSSSGIEKNQIGAYLSYTIPVIPQAGDDPSVVQNVVIEQTPSRQAVYLLDYPLEGSTPQGMEVLAYKRFTERSEIPAYKRFAERSEISAGIGDHIDICIDTYHPAQPCGCEPHHNYGESCGCGVRPRRAGYSTSCTTYFINYTYVPRPEPIPERFPPLPPPFPNSPGPPLNPGGHGFVDDETRIAGYWPPPPPVQDEEQEDEEEREDWLRENSYNWQMCLLTSSGACANQNELVVTRRVDGSYNYPSTIGMTSDVSDSLMNIVNLMGVRHLSKWDQKWLADHRRERVLIEQFLEREVEEEWMQRQAEIESRITSAAGGSSSGSSIRSSPLTKAGQFILALLPGLVNESINRRDLEDILSDKIIITREFKSSKAGRVFEKLKQVSGGFKQMIQKFDGEFPVSHLRFTLGVSHNYRNANAVTSRPNNYVIEIKVNPNRFNRPDLDIARTLIHETIHAEIFRKLLSLSNTNGYINYERLKQMLQRGDFPGLLDYYTRYKEEFQHQQMSAHYIKVIADMLQEFDNNEHSRQFYEDISWGGLMGYGKPFNHNTGLYPNSTQAWIDLGREERLRILKVRGDFLESYKN